ncbi:flagellar assembly protein FliW [Pallidibacillus thermolactis]|uniref:flagellar assembly protein FliW n=1 Tax=Pallidibacillus thermolactis TaxID=251051 RepID=UPI002E1B62EF|nr:flagellar assembly protein FliW [Pallidibacillus thermolactis]MED1672239.1 flagellar assembly protein FliW [Pallidibacillus thermolactis subsp. kokeshiiformis]
MNIQTKYFNEITIEEKNIIHFEHGIPGFLEEKQFVLLPLTEDNVYYVLQSVQTSELAFVVTNPFLFFKDYDFNLDDATVEQLEIKDATDVAVYSILTLQDPFEKTTANLQAPIIINTKNNHAKQVILNDEKYTTKHPLFKASPASVKG